MIFRVSSLVVCGLLEGRRRNVSPKQRRRKIRGEAMTTVASTEQTGLDGSQTITVRGSASGFAQEITVGPHRLRADEPMSVGGTNAGPNPYDLLLAALGSCTSMTLAMYARRKRWPLESVTVRLRHTKVYAADCESCETREGRVDHVHRDVELSGPLSAEQRARLLEIANKCPVHRTLESEIVIETNLSEVGISGMTAA
jgi:putative redox protein